MPERRLVRTMTWSDVDKPDKRFEGEFELQWGGDPGQEPPEQAKYKNVIDKMMDRLSQHAARDPKGSDAAVLVSVQRRTDARNWLIGQLREEAKKFVAAPPRAEMAAENSFRYEGAFIREMEWLNARLFDVDVVYEEVKDEGGKTTRRYATDLSISMNNGGEGRDRPTASPEQLALFSALSAVVRVVKALKRSIDDKALRASWWHNWWGLRRFAPDREKERERARTMTDESIRKLSGIARLGLEGPQTQLSMLALSDFRADLVALEAGRIKNGYLRSLGVPAGLAALVLLAAYFAARSDCLKGTVWGKHDLFFLVACGAAVGAWLSFAVRRVTLTFEELGAPEEDLLSPSTRIIFVIGLATIAMLMLWTGMISATIGSLSTSALFAEPGQGTRGAVALLIGLLCGLSERALATAIGGRAAAFSGRFTPSA
jgi:hypothetical protein